MLPHPAHPGAGPSYSGRALRFCGARAGACAALLLGLALAMALSGCVSRGSTNDPTTTNSDGGDPASGTSIVGGWTLQPDAACRESLAFLAGGRFVHGVAVAVQGQSLLRLADGSYTAGPSDNGALDVQIAPQDAVTDPLQAYCGQWQNATRSDLPLAAVQQSTGIDLTTLAWRPLALSGGGLAWVGSDAGANVDRFALVRDAEVLHGFVLDDGLAEGTVLLHREPLHLDTSLPRQFPGVPMVNLPQQAFAFHTDEAGSDVLVKTLLLSLHSAVDIDFSPQAATAKAYPACKLAALDAKGVAVTPNPLADVGTAPVVTINPGDPGQFPPLLRTSVSSADASETAYLLYLAVRTPATGPCQVNLRAQPLAARLASQHVQQGSSDAFTVTLQDAAAYLTAVPVGQPARLALLPLQAPVEWQADRLLGQVMQPSTAPADPLGLQSGSSRTVRVSVQSSGRQRFLNVFPVGSATGLGPFAPYAAPSASALTLRGDPVPFTDSTQVELRFTLAAATEVRLYSDGGADTTGLLLDEMGNAVASAHGGATDGAGFRIVASLPAGTYRLQVRSAAAADFAVYGELPADRGLADARLDACLRMAGAAGANAAALLASDCQEQGITSLAGIGVYSGLQVLRLDDNAITDLTPLGDLAELGVLSLSGTQPASLAPLAGLTRLYCLVLARVALDADALAVLKDMGTRLTWLDLNAATGLSDADVTALKDALPNTTLIAPDGTVME